MKIKKNIICIFFGLILITPISVVCDELQQIDAQASEKGYQHYDEVPIFVQFNPNDSYSFIVYKKGDIVQYNGKVYQAIAKTNNNTVPPEDSRWQLLAQQSKLKPTSK